MKKQLFTATSLLITGLFVASCGAKEEITYFDASTPGTATIKIYKNNQSTSKNRFVAPKNVTIKNTYQSLSGVLANNNTVCPSTGDVKLLVIPVHLPGSKQYMTEEVKKDIEKVFFSNDERGLGFPSVASFYKESSYGKLNFSGTVTDWFDVTRYTSIKSIDDVTGGADGTIMNEILHNAASWAMEHQGIDLNDYDYDKDGTIDGIWFIYDQYDFLTNYAVDSIKNPFVNLSDYNQALGNFTTWDYYGPSYGQGVPTVSGFSWASVASMYNGYAPHDEYGVVDVSSYGNVDLDSHIYIHETGHLLGLDDYYVSNNSARHPAGQYTMMDENVCDLDSYSKLLLGWVTPYVVYGTSEIVIPKATSSDHAVIVIPHDFEDLSESVEYAIKKNKIDKFTYEFNPFSEYMLIDLYSPDGLNEKDSSDNTIYGRESAPTDTGVRIYHIDSRIFKVKVINYDGGSLLSYDLNNPEWDGGKLNNDEAILMPISNGLVESMSFGLPQSYDYFDQIRLIEASGINSFDQSGKFNNDTLFTTTTGDFSIIEYGYQFFNANYSFNSGEDLPFMINVKTLKEIL